MYIDAGTLLQSEGLIYIYRCQHAFTNSGPICTQMPVRFHKVPDEIERSRDLRGGRWSWTFKLAQKRS